MPKKQFSNVFQLGEQEMKKFTVEEKETIQLIKNYLKEIRQLNNKLAFLMFTKENKELKTYNFKYADKNSEESAISVQIEELQKELDNFIKKTYIIEQDEIEILSIYVESRAYKDMIKSLNRRGIEEHTYTRKIPYICLKLSDVINLDDFGSIQKANCRYLKRIKGE